MESIRSTRRLARAIAFGSLLLALALAANAAHAGPFEEGLNFFQGGHYRWALQTFVESTDQAPRDWQRWWYLAESYRMLGDAPGAAHIYRQILQLAPQTPFADSARQALEALGEPGMSTVQVPIQRRGGSAVVPARVNGEAVGVFILDTGASYTSLSMSVARLGCSATLAAFIWSGLGLDPLLSWLLSVNLVTFLTYGYDKQIAGTGRMRVPERVLLLLALAGGSPAAWLGMRTFHHKTAKQSFTRRF